LPKSQASVTVVFGTLRQLLLGMAC
jgi:hypothetical protein